MKSPEASPASIEQREKPKVLYHASTMTDIDELEPRNISRRSDEEGPVVFATPSKSVATFFLVEGCDNSWTSMGQINGVKYMMLAIDRDEFIAKDKGGAIYTLSNEGFECDETKGMKRNEWTCSVKTKPLSKEIYPSALEAMLGRGVQVYFVDKNTYQEFMKLKENPGEFMKTLTSENQRKGVNVKEFYPVDREVTVSENERKI